MAVTGAGAGAGVEIMATGGAGAEEKNNLGSATLK